MHRYFAQSPFGKRIAALTVAAAAVATVAAQQRGGAQPARQATRPFSVVEATIPEMRTAMEQGRVTSRELVRQYLERLGMYEDTLHAAIAVNHARARHR